ncbi:MAG: SRPBCC family protein [Sulfuricaulis sp.]
MNHSKQQPTAIRLMRRFRAPPRRVFDAWLDPEMAGRWLFATASRPMTDVEIDARVGGGFRLAEWRNGESHEHHGRYLEIVPPHRLVFTLRERRGATRVIVEITPHKRGCELRLHHENVPPDRAHDTEARWTGILYGLGETLASRPGQSQDRR